MKSNFAITDNKGFQMTFANGWTVSVQFGEGNYCSNHDISALIKSATNPQYTPYYECHNAEIAAWDKDGNWFQFETDSVKGWVSADEVASFISDIASKHTPGVYEAMIDEDPD